MAGRIGCFLEERLGQALASDRGRFFEALMTALGISLFGTSGQAVEVTAEGMGAEEGLDQPAKRATVRVEAAGEAAFEEVLRQVRRDLRHSASGPKTEPAAVCLVVGFDGTVDESGNGLSFQVRQAKCRRLLLEAVFDPKRCSPLLAGRLLRRLNETLAIALQRPETPVAQLLQPDPVERHQMLAEWNDTQKALPRQPLLHLLVERQARRAPERLAVIKAQRHLSFEELNRQAGRLAVHLRSRGVGPESVVAIRMERQLGLITGLLGILKAGGAYLPLDPDYPQSWQESAILQAGARFQMPSLNCQLPTANCQLNSPVDAQNLAYVIYTSGSTGEPKGAAISHRAVCNHLLWMGQRFPLHPGDRVLHKAPISFDASVWEIFPPLIQGAQLVLARPGGQRDGRQLARLIRQQGITVFHLVPSLLQSMLEEGLLPDCSSLRHLSCGGEAFSAPLLTALRRAFPEAEICNFYGPTETTVDATCWDAGRPSPTAIAPIGRPIHNLRTYLLDSRMQPVAEGAQGELYIAGEGLARGYLGRPALTARCFVPDPFSPYPGARLYRSGDLARHLPAGDLEFLGRADRQVKLRGFRIETAQVEAVLTQHPSLQQALVTLLQDNSGPRLAAYLLPRPGSVPDSSELRRFLLERLPEYMVPSDWEVVRQWPRTPSGKIDIQALEPPQREGRLLSAQEKPRSPYQEVLAGIWSETLGVDPVGRLDNFFELGGHSLAAARVMARIRQAFQIDLPLQDLFLSEHLEDLASRLETALNSLEQRPKSLPTVKRVSRQHPLPVSLSQERAWFIHQLAPRNFAYNAQLAIWLRGRLQPGALSATLTEIVRRHEILRTTFRDSEDGPQQTIHPPWPAPLPLADLSSLQGQQQLNEKNLLFERLSRRPFNLSQLPLARWLLIRMADQTHVLVQSEHHMIHDGWSLACLLREMEALYVAFSQSRPSPLREPPFQFADLSCWEREWMRGEVRQSYLDYWKGQLQGCPSFLDFPADRLRPEVPSFRGDAVRAILPSQTYQAVKALGRSQGSTLFMTLLATFKVLLQRHTGRRDMVVGSTVANRWLRESEGLLGMLVNNIVLRTDLGGDPTFLELLQRVRQVTLQAYAHQELPFDQLVEALAPARDLSRNPLIQVFFSFHDAPVPELNLGDVKGEIDYRTNGSAKFDLDVLVIPRAEQQIGLQDTDRQAAEGDLVLWEYSSDLFDRTTIERLAGQFQVLLQAIVSDPRQAISQLPVLNEAQRHQLLAEWAEGGDLPFPQRPVQHIFEEQAQRNCAAIAIAFQRHQVSYGELKRRSDGLAARLRNLGAGPETLVGICLERSLEMGIALMGILKSGGAYLPLHPATPHRRLAELAGGAGLWLAVASPQLASLFPSSVRTLPLEGRLPKSPAGRSLRPGSAGRRRPGAPASCGPLQSGSAQPPGWKTPREQRPARCGRSKLNSKFKISESLDALAYVIFTSGSSGTPKGVLVTHASLVNDCAVFSRTYRLGRCDRVLQFASLSFDAAAEEFFPTWMQGGTVVLPAQEPQSIPRFLDLIRREQLTVVDLPPAYWNEWVAELPRLPDPCPRPLRSLLVGGDRVLPHNLAAWKESVGERVQWVNGYGPTEATITTSNFEPGSRGWQDCLKLGTVPIGRPIDHAQVLLLDRRLKPLPVGAAGELHIGGKGLARGYLGQAGQTAEKFIPHPFSTRPGERLYRSGDLARWLPSGDLTVLGRLDSQLKVRSIRIEPGEVEAALQQHPQVRRAVVVARQERLVAYLVSEPGGRGPEIGRAEWEIEEFLRERLPEYMIPAGFVVLDELPLTRSGKVELAALPTPTGAPQDRQTEFVSPQTPIEGRLAGIWAEALGLERVGVQDDFFRLGGHSLLATRILSRIRRDLEADLPLRTLFEAPTVRRLARRLEKAPPAQLRTPLPVQQRPAEIPLSFAQQRLWLLSRLWPANPFYNLNPAWELRGGLNRAALQASLSAIVQRHEALRTCFPQVGNQPVQKVMPLANPVPVPEIDLSGLDRERRHKEVRRCSRQAARRPFDPLGESLFRALLVRLGNTAFRLQLTLHHLVADGWSVEIMERELVAHYQAACRSRLSRLPALPCQYVDFTLWQQRCIQDNALREGLAHWRRRLQDAEPLELPFDRPRSDPPSFRGGRCEISLPARLNPRLHSLGQSHRATLFMTLMASLQALLHRCSGQSSVVVGTPLANRTRPEFEDLVGLFVNSLPLCSRLNSGQTFSELLQQISRSSLQDHRYQEVPFEKLVEELQPHRETGRNPLFQVMLAFQGTRSPEIEANGLRIRPVDTETGTARLDLEFHLWERPDGLRGFLVYSRDLFDHVTAGRLLRHWCRLLQSAAARPHEYLHDLPLLDVAERHQLLHEWCGAEAPLPQASIDELFNDQAARRPDSAALDYGEGWLSYSELNRRAERLANVLRQSEVGPESAVGVLLKRSPQLVTALLAVLKAGSAYLPLDPSHPSAHLSFMLRDSGCKVLISEGDRPQADGLKRISPWADPPFTTRRRRTFKPRQPSLAYLIYTSGSTGRPKGVAVPHRAVIRLVLQTDYVTLGPSDRIAQASNAAFDAATFEIWGALLNGARLVGLTPEQALSARQLSHQIRQRAVNTLFLTTALFNQMARRAIEGFGSLDHLLFGGEAVDAERVALVLSQAPPRRLLHVYGPTENTTFSSWHRVRNVAAGAATVPIGRAIANTRIHLLDDRFNPVPCGVAAELLLGGLGLARGYVGRPSLTARRFVPDPWADKPGMRLYRSGDRVRRRPGGEIEFLGRFDQQLKLRGFRVEPGEVESVLCEHPGVAEAAVLPRRDQAGTLGLVAYVVSSEGRSREGEEKNRGERRDSAQRESAVQSRDLLSHLKALLPQYMIPSAFVFLNSLPLTPGGKLDRKGLPEPVASAGVPYLAPEDELQRLLASIWKEVLQAGQVGAEDNFFDLGGHSLLLIEVQRRLEAELGRTIPMVELFRHPTVRSLSGFLADQRFKVQTTRPKVQDPEPATFAPDSRLPAPASRSASEPIAIIGMAGRFPGARDVDEFWENLRQGVESITFFSDQQLRQAGVDAELIGDPRYVKANGMIEDVELFDAGFFGLTPREAELMDPQHRLALECAWLALEDAGYEPSRYQGRIGVFAGQSVNTYLTRNLMSNPDLIEAAGDMLVSLQNRIDHLASRIAYKLDLTGPSLNVQTACSTSLAAVHLACRALLDGQCEMALAGGVSVRVPHRTGYLHREGDIVSPDGHCRAFDARAQGTVGGDGGALVVLKRLSRAQGDGDSVRALILGSALNNDGSRKVGFTAPGVEGQSKVIADALSAAGVSADTITFLEGHGTATPLGDPIEVEAATRAFRQHTNRKGFCALGSVKSNIGHLDAAAGVAGLVKAVLALEKRAIPPTLHFEEPNPEIDFGESPFYPHTRLADWKGQAGARRAGVSSFGFGGTNVHAVLQEAPGEDETDLGRRQDAGAPGGRDWQLLPVSARSDSALHTSLSRLANHLQTRSEQRLSDVAYTLQVGRRAFPQRGFVLARNRLQALEALAGDSSDGIFLSPSPARTRPVAFLFPGQGSQHSNMAAQIYATEPAFRREINHCAEILGKRTQKSESDLGPWTLDFGPQASLFIAEYSLARLWMSWGVRPKALLGHSLGEWVAACLSGVFSLEDALSLIVQRERLMEQLPTGAMLAVSLSAAQLRKRLPQGLAMAAENHPGLCTVSGSADGVERFQQELARENVGCRRLKVDRAFHSCSVDSAMAPLAEAVSRVKRHPPRIPFLSNRTGKWITDQEAADPNHWAQQMRHTVLFSQGLDELLGDPSMTLLEVGPGRTLSAICRSHTAFGDGHRLVTSLPGGDEERSLIEALGGLWTAGIEVDWEALQQGRRPKRVPLPGYPFEGQRYWVEAQPPGKAIRPSRRSEDPSDWFYLPRWKQSVPLPAQAEAKQDGQDPWLVFCNQGELGERLLARLRDRGVCWIRVQAGDGIQQIDKKCYQINPSRAEDYRSLLASLDRPPCRILFLWSWAVDSRDVGFDSLMHLAQAWGSLPEPPQAEILVVTAPLHQVTGQEHLIPEQSALLGPCRVIPREYPQLGCRVLDTALDCQQERLLSLLTRSLLDSDIPPLQAFRGGEAWIPLWEPVRLPARSEAPAVLRQRGVYLITGGLGGIGLEVAGYLARTVQARLALLGRSAFPKPEDWPSWLQSHDPDDDVSATIQRLTAFQQEGAEVLPLQADVSQADQVREALEKLRSRFGAVHGIFHCAGLPGQGLIHSKSREEAERVMAPKVAGTRLLEGILESDAPDFLMLFSSQAALLGAYGQADYVAANAVLDAFAQDFQRRFSCWTVSVNWNAWNYVGMRVRTGRQLGLSDSTAEDSVSVEQGLDLLRRILHSGLASNLAVSRRDLPAVLERVAAGDYGPALKELDQPSPPPVHARPELLTPFVAPQTPAQESLAGIWKEVLGIGQIGIRDSFLELGGDSLKAIQIIARAEKAGLRLTAQQVLGFPTIERLSSQLGPAPQAETGSVPDLEIRPRPLQRYQPFPLTEVQQAYWIGRGEDFELGNVSCHGYRELDCPSLDLQRLEAAWQRLIAHHEMLRCVVSSEGRQRILRQVPSYRIARLDLRSLSDQQSERCLLQIRNSMSHQVLPSDRWPLFDLRASLLGRGRIRLHCSFDCLIADDLSLLTLYRQLVGLYNRPDTVLPELEVTFRDCVLAQQAVRETEQYRQDLEFWRSRLDDLPPGPQLPLARRPSDLKQPRFQVLRAELEASQWRKIKSRASGRGATAAAVLLTAFAEVLALWSRSPRMTLNLPLYNRPPLHPRIDELVGVFTSVVLVEADLSRPQPFQERLQDIQKRLAANIDRRKVSGVRVLRELARRHPRGSGVELPVVFNCLVGSEADQPSAFPLDELGKTVYGVTQTPQVWLDNGLDERQGQLFIRWSVVQDLFPPGVANSLFEAYCNLIRQLAGQEEAWLSDSLLRIPAEQLLKRQRVNDTNRHQQLELLHNPFLKRATRHPDRVALLCDQGAFSYADLCRRAAWTAEELFRMGARPERPVAVVMEKGWEQVVAVLGIHLAGAPYLPIDPELPRLRLQYLLENGQAELAVAQSRTAERIPAGHKVLLVQGGQPKGPAKPPAQPRQKAQDLAYLIYTSGSTGFPKGVMISHQAAANTVLDINRRFDLQAGDRVLALSSLSFDLSVYDIFGTLAAGAAIVMPEAGQRQDPAHWARLLVRHSVTVWNSVPALMQLLCEYGRRHPSGWADPLRLVMMSGDWIPVGLPNRIRSIAPRARQISLGGATEASIWSIFHPIQDVQPNCKSIPYGRPLANQTFHVLDEQMRPCPDWVAGQLYIAGEGLAEGYWRDEEKTRSSFVTHPRSGERLYRTGDLGRYLPDGNIEFLGREDFQVKIQGHRIELGEIEVALRQHSQVRDAVVSVVESEGVRRLAAYVVTDNGEAIDSASLRRHLEERLPQSMLPFSYQILESFPLNSNGKVDRPALPAPQTPSLTAADKGEVDITPGLAAQVNSLVAEILNRDFVDPLADLFELGATSIEMTRIANRLEEEFHFRPRLNELFQLPTVQALLNRYHSQLSPAENGGPTTSPPPDSLEEADWEEGEI